VVKPATIRTVLTIAATRQWPIHQLDVKNVFLHCELQERVYCQQPASFIDPDKPNHVCLLVKSLYGLSQAPRAWYQRFAGHLRTMGFTSTVSDSSLFVYKQGSNMVWLLLYVDDIVLTASSGHYTTSLASKFVVRPRHLPSPATVRRGHPQTHWDDKLQACYHSG
jgi:hypothetical protein